MFKKIYHLFSSRSRCVQVVLSSPATLTRIRSITITRRSTIIMRKKTIQEQAYDLQYGHYKSVERPRRHVPVPTLKTIVTLIVFTCSTDNTLWVENGMNQRRGKTYIWCEWDFLVGARRLILCKKHFFFFCPPNVYS